MKLLRQKTRRYKGREPSCTHHPLNFYRDAFIDFFNKQRTFYHAMWTKGFSALFTDTCVNIIDTLLLIKIMCLADMKRKRSPTKSQPSNRCYTDSRGLFEYSQHVVEKFPSRQLEFLDVISRRRCETVPVIGESIRQHEKHNKQV